jgi:hypothetical protein
VAEADRLSVLIPTIVPTWNTLAQVKAKVTLVGAKAAVGVSAMTKLCACPAAILTGVLAVPVSALVVGSVV